MRSSSSIDLHFVSGFLIAFAIIWDRQLSTWPNLLKTFAKGFYRLAVSTSPISSSVRPYSS